MKRKGWHRKKRRLRHDWRKQLGNQLWNFMKCMREDSANHAREFERFLVDCMSERNAGA